MDPEPASVSNPSAQWEGSSKSLHESGLTGSEPEEPFSLSVPSIALLGLTIAIATVGVPLAAVLTDRPASRESMAPTALEKKDGSKFSSPISLTRGGQLGGGDPGRKSE